MVKDNPVFVRGLSRSGGTLMVTILDAHPDIAMSYELYPHLLVKKDGVAADVSWLLKLLKSAKNLKWAGAKALDRNVRVFLLRCMRGGLDKESMVRLLTDHQDEGMNFDGADGRLIFIMRCCREKMKREGKTQWGAKCTGAYKDYLSIFPGARFLNIVRDGRDVLASQLNTGKFTKTPEELGESWAKNHIKFRKLVGRDDVNAYEVLYEQMAEEPEKAIREICDFLDVTFSSSILDFHKKDLTIFQSDVGHLSAKRISKPIDTSRIGRWKQDLSEKQLDQFCGAAREAMVMFGYLRE